MNSQASVRLRSLLPSLSDMESRLADYILRDLDRIPFLSVYEIADAAGVSVATVTRLVQKAGFRGLKDFKVEIAWGRGADEGYFYEAINRNDTDLDMVQKVFFGNIKSIEDTFGILDKENLVHAIDAICSASDIYLFGIGSSALLARDAAMRFSFLGLPAQSFSDPNDVFAHALEVKGGDVVVGISHSGRTKITVDALALAREHGAISVGISNYLNSPLHSSCTLFLCTSFPETRVKFAALSSRIAQMCILDAMYILCARRVRTVDGIEKTNEQLEELLRYPSKGEPS